MAINEDGLEAGQPVDYATLVRVESERKKKKEDPKPVTTTKRAK